MRTSPKISARKEVQRLERLLAQNSAMLSALIGKLVSTGALPQDALASLLQTATEIAHGGGGHTHHFKQSEGTNEYVCECGERMWTHGADV